MKKHYHLGNLAEGADKLDTDVLDRFSRATKGSRDMAIRIIAADLTDGESRKQLRRVGRLAVEYEAMVWGNYFTEGMKRAGMNPDVRVGRRA